MADSEEEGALCKGPSQLGELVIFGSILLSTESTDTQETVSITALRALAMSMLADESRFSSGSF